MPILDTPKKKKLNRHQATQVIDAAFVRIFSTIRDAPKDMDGKTYEQVKEALFDAKTDILKLYSPSMKPSARDDYLKMWSVAIASGACNAINVPAWKSVAHSMGIPPETWPERYRPLPREAVEIPVINITKD